DSLSLERSILCERKMRPWYAEVLYKNCNLPAQHDGLRFRLRSHNVTTIYCTGRRVMKLSNLTIALCFGALLCLSPAQAQEMHTHQHDASEKLGQVNFTVACKPAVRREFNRATALLHSFWYAESEKAYAGVAKTDPACAMAY